MNGFRTVLGVCAAAFPLLASGISAADWPTARHDSRRTGVSTAPSDIEKPAAYWRARLGGVLSPNQVHLGDVDQDGQLDVLFVAGGELVLSGADGTKIWRTGSRDYSQIVGLADLDADGYTDVVVSTPAAVSIISGQSGKIEWVEPKGELGTPGAFRIGDVNGDAIPDLWLDTCGCCAIENGSPGVLYSFSKGFGAALKLGEPPARPHCGASSNTLVDLDGDGRLDMVNMSDNEAFMFDGDGNVIAHSDNLPQRAYAAQCEAANLDGLPGDELVCFTNWVYAGAGERGLYALGYDGLSNSLKLLWNAVVSAADAGDARAPVSLTSDLDGDGHPEAIVSGKANGAYTTFVMNAETGALLASITGIAAGDVASVKPGRRWLLVQSGDNTTAFEFANNPPGLSPVWQVAGRSVVTSYDWARSQRSGLVMTIATPDLNGDGVPEFLARSTSEPVVLNGYDTQTGSATALGQYSLDPGVDASAVAVATQTGGIVTLAARTDGFVALLDTELQPTNALADANGSVPGFYVGGYYTGRGATYSQGLLPIGGKMEPGDTADSILVVDSRGDLVRIDPTGASLVAPAKPAWRLQDTFGAGIKPAALTSASIGAFRRVHPISDPPKYVMASISPNGKELHSLQLARPPQWDVIPADFAGAGNTAFAAMATDSTLATEVTCMSSGGAQLWQAPVKNVSGTQPFAVGDWDGDGADDVAAFVDVAHVFSGKSGAEIATGSDALNYYMPVLVDLTGDSVLEMLLQGGYSPARALAHDLTKLWTSNGPSQPYPYGSAINCSSGGVLVEGSFSAPSQLTFTRTTGPTAGTTTSIVLASGAAYSDETGATSAGATLGQLSDVAASTNLSGSATPNPTALVGSTDGYLYAVDGCSAALLWSLDFGMPVSSPVLLDSDGDGIDEIIVSVADGYLYALKNQVLPAPAYVWDTDPLHGITDKDVDDIQTSTVLYASWAPVSGADSYEVAVVGSAGAYVTTPSWTNVGAVTTTTIANLQLFDGGRYFVGVRAVSQKGKSPDAASDGVTVHFSVGDGGDEDAASGGATNDASDGAAASAGSGAVGGCPEPGDVLSGRACTCSIPGGSNRPTSDAIWLVGLVGVILARRATGQRVGDAA